jgi:hypothetical protein
MNKLAVVYSGDREARAKAAAGEPRYAQVLAEIKRQGAQGVPVVYADEVADEVRRDLLACGGAVVWVDPIHAGGETRGVLDPILREVAAAGIFVSAHPDVILRMGTKQVLYDTREMPWSSGDIRLYRSVQELRAGLRLDGGPRVLKQNRGNGGNGVWRVEGAGGDRVRVLHALRGSRQQEVALDELLATCMPYFAAGGQMLDQPFVSPEPGGMVRCYMTHAEVVGFGHQHVTALTGPEPPAPQPRRYYPPSQPEFQAIKRRMEAEWLPQMETVLGVAERELPVIWDADFMPGDVLCEINVSCVSPFPDAALPKLVEAAIRRLQP